MSNPDLDALLDAVIGSEGLVVSNKSSSVDDLLDTDILSFSINEDGSSNQLIELVELAEGELDPRLKLLSHSSRTLLKTCARKYQLNRLNSTAQDTDAIKMQEGAVTFAYGSAVGVGLQSTLESKTEDQILLDVFLAWDTDLLDATPRQNKSFWLAVFATQKFISIRSNGYLSDYELVYYNGKPAIEMAFQIALPNGYKYRGFLDAVLRNIHTGEIVVFEAKTSSGTAQSAAFKNSGQALGYSVVLDILFPELSSYVVLYLVYETKTMQYKELPFTKSLLQRALWLQELVIDTKIIDLYSSYDTFPMSGHSCFDFFRECEYLGLCTLKTENLVKPLSKQILEKVDKDEAKYDFKLDFYDLVESQINKGEE